MNGERHKNREDVSTLSTGLLSIDFLKQSIVVTRPQIVTAEIPLRQFEVLESTIPHTPHSLYHTHRDERQHEEPHRDVLVASILSVALFGQRVGAELAEPGLCMVVLANHLPLIVANLLTIVLHRFILPSFTVSTLQHFGSYLSSLFGNYFASFFLQRFSLVKLGR